MAPNEPKCSFFGQNPVFPAKIDADHFFRPKSTETGFFRQKAVFRPKLTKTTFLGQIRPKQVISAKIDQNHIVRAENRKIKTAKLRPKREKQTPFSSVLIPSPGRGRGRGRYISSRRLSQKPRWMKISWNQNQNPRHY